MKPQSLLIAATASIFAFSINGNAYNISGSTLAELERKFIYTGRSGQRCGAQTFAPVEINSPDQGFTWTKGPNKMKDGKCLITGTCTATSFKIEMKPDAYTDYPFWDDEEQAPCDLIKTEWNRYLGRVRSHEKGHINRAKAFGQNAVSSYEQKLNAIESIGEGETEAIAKAHASADFRKKRIAIREELEADMQASIFDKYDDNTGNGATERANLRLNIKCP